MSAPQNPRDSVVPRRQDFPFTSSPPPHPARPLEMSSPPTTNPAPADTPAPAAVNPAPDIIEAVDDDESDADSALGQEEASSTASIESTILQYRKFKGRSYHSAVHDTKYFLPIDDQTLENFDLIHHFLTLMTDDKLHLAPIKPGASKILDVGTGTGIWAIDFADENPDISVVGTDLSPVQPTWIPPNLYFEIDDCTKQWTWDVATFDFVHIRYLFGSIKDWVALYKEAYRVLKPGAYLESVETEATYFSDDGTIANDGVTALGGKFGEMFIEAGKITGNSMSLITDGTQVKAMKEAGFVDIQEVTYKLPIGAWPRDEKLAQIGNFAKQSLLGDLAGYLQLIWHQVVKWPPEEFENFLLQIRQELRNRRLHPYVKVRFVWGRKPE
ncbi:S-adenosyl-L-methionine-dependent methyltransferase [Plectosphaerella cucumerina]|uniref:S-adenosyl-L-methionine-dependent methyltransferase n=1 Tax=Plectosphaerella cucumerina TaxID=40658 RepID=A0A8K0TK94_9PEZI|nr:S-adenosyl-L-methionine-dependent methyltransferase [Plectosphaerella cucumerina]